MMLFFLGIYIGIGICLSIAMAFGAALGDSINSLLCSPVLVVLWPLLFFRWFRRLWR